MKPSPQAPPDSTPPSPPPPRRIKQSIGIAAGLLLAAAIVFILLFVDTHTSNGLPVDPAQNTPEPNLLKFVGLQPGGTSELRSKAGDVTGELHIRTDMPNNDGEISRNLILEYPADRDLIFPAMFGGHVFTEPVGFGKIYPLVDHEGKKRIIVYSNLNAATLHKAGRTTADWTIPYYVGPRRTATLTFNGPFTQNASYPSPSQPAATLTVNAIDLLQHDEPTFNLQIDRNLLEEESVGLAYDKQGKRYLLWGRGEGRSGFFKAEGLLLEDIATITIGEPPLKQVIDNVTVIYPSRPESTPWSQSNQALMKRASTELTERKQLLTPDERAELRNIISTWTTSANPSARYSAAAHGLHHNWPEFVDPAIDLLETPLPTEQQRYQGWQHATDGLAKYAGPVTAEQTRRMTDLMLDANASHDTHTNRSRRALDSVNRAVMLRLKLNPDQPGSLEALIRVAESDYPWLWYNAVSALQRQMFFRSAQDDGRELSHKLLVRHAFLQSIQSPDKTPPLADDVYAMLPGLLTHDVYHLDSNVFNRALQQLARRTPRDNATEAMADYVQQAEPAYHYWGALTRIARHLNALHETNIGGFGADQDARLPDDPAAHDWASIRSEILKQHQDVQD